MCFSCQQPIYRLAEFLKLALDDPTYYRVRSGVHIRGRAFTDLAKEHFEQLWTGPRLYKLRTAMGENEEQVSLLSEQITRLKNLVCIHYPVKRVTGRVIGRAETGLVCVLKRNIRLNSRAVPGIRTKCQTSR
jgi:hypothetical protein